MACAHDPARAALRIERHAHRRHEGAGAENTAKIAIDCTHDFRRGFVFGVRVMKKQFRQRGQQRRGRAMAGGISNPKKHPAVAHAKPAVNIAPHLNDRPIKPRTLQPGQHWWCGWKQQSRPGLTCRNKRGEDRATACGQVRALLRSYQLRRRHSRRRSTFMPATADSPDRHQPQGFDSPRTSSFEIESKSNRARRVSARRYSMAAHLSKSALFDCQYIRVELEKDGFVESIL